jgi:YidC/Oxa1 family membrane protein insertase
MLIQQSMMPKSEDPKQQMMQKIMKFMMIGFAVILYNYSSGLMLYFVGSNSLGMAESWYIRNKVLPAMEKKRDLKKA